jgi:hypothetical protein
MVHSEMDFEPLQTLISQIHTTYYFEHVRVVNIFEQLDKYIFKYLAIEQLKHCRVAHISIAHFLVLSLPSQHTSSATDIK